MRISDVLRAKGDNVVTITPETDVTGLLRMLAEHRIGAVVVSGDGSTPAGIVSERDVVRALAAHGPAVLSGPVSAIATADVKSVPPETSVEEVERLMTGRRFRHVPVVVEGRLAGIVSMRDVVQARIDELETERATLTGYITGERS